MSLGTPTFFAQPLSRALSSALSQVLSQAFSQALSQALSEPLLSALPKLSLKLSPNLLQALSSALSQALSQPLSQALFALSQALPQDRRDNALWSLGITQRNYHARLENNLMSSLTSRTVMSLNNEELPALPLPPFVNVSLRERDTENFQRRCSPVEIDMEQLTETKLTNDTQHDGQDPNNGIQKPLRRTENEQKQPGEEHRTGFCEEYLLGDTVRSPSHMSHPSD